MPLGLSAVLVAITLLFVCNTALGQDVQPTPGNGTIIRPNLTLTTLEPEPTIAYPASECRGTDTPKFDELAEVRYTEQELQGLVNQTKAEVIIARRAALDALRSPDEAWAGFCAKYGLTAILGDARHKRKFLRNMKVAVEKNRGLEANGEDMLAYGITQFSHLDETEFQQTMLDQTMGRGGDPTGPGRRLLQGSTPYNKDVAFPYANDPQPPACWDWRAAGVITPVKSQGGCGSCSAFASMATLESTWIRKWWSKGYRSSNTDLSEDDWLECRAGNQCKGAWPDSIMDQYIGKGAPFEWAQPYNAHDGNVCKPAGAINRYNVGAKGFAYVPANSATLAKSVKRNPTVIAVDASNWSGLAAGWVRNCGEPGPKINHAVTVVGWVNNVKMSNGQFWDYWFVRNSWGANFVNNGYIWIRKDCGGDGPYGMYKYKHWTPIM